METLFLGDNHIGDDGVRSLALAFERNTLSHLKILSLCGNKIGDDGARSLTSVFEKNKFLSLESLDLSSNRIGDDGTGSFTSAFEKNPSWPLRFLDLRDNRMGNDSIKLILERNLSLVEICCDFQALHEFQTAVITTKAPLQRWNGDSLNPNILKAREVVKISVLLCSLQITSTGPARLLPPEIVKLIGKKIL